MIKTIFFLLLAATSFGLKAQFNEIEDAMSKGKQKGISIHLDTFNKAIANDAVIKIMSDKDRKVSPSILSFNELFFDNITIQSVSSGVIDVYIKIKEVDSSIVIFTDMGTAFLDAEKNPKETAAMQQLAIEIRHHIREINRLNNIDSLKKKIKTTDNNLERATDDLKAANNVIKNNTKGAANNDKEVIERETRLKDENAQIRAMDSIRLIKEKEFDAFPIIQLKAVNQSKNNALDKNRSTRKNLIKNNVKSSEKITEYETQIMLNKGSLDIVKDDPKASKKLVKANQQLTSKINEEKLKITLNDASIKSINGVIFSDSLIVKTNTDSLNIFDENGRKRELKQMENKKEKLQESTEKHRLEIDKNKLESEQRKKENEEILKKLDAMKEKQAMLTKELEGLRAELKLLEKK